MSRKHNTVHPLKLRKEANDLQNIRLGHRGFVRKEPEYDPFADNDNNADIFTASKDDGICKRCGKPIDYYNFGSHCDDLNRRVPDRYYHPSISESDD